MAVTEVFADGLSGVRIVGETVRLEFASLAGGEGGGLDPRVRVVLPAASLAGLVDLLLKAQSTLGQGRPGAVAGRGGIAAHRARERDGADRRG